MTGPQGGAIVNKGLVVQVGSETAMTTRRSSSPSPAPVAVMGILLMLALGCAVTGWIQGGKDVAWGYWLFSAGVAGVFAIGGIGAAAFMLAGLLGARGGDSLSDGTSHKLLMQIHEHTMLSDKAKRVVYREKELQLLRSSIETDISRRDFDAALILCDVMAEDFGYRGEAEQYRQRIIGERKEQYDSQVQAAMGYFEQLLDRRDWGRVHAEAARIRRLFPESMAVQDLDRKIEQARTQHKRQLEGEFMESAQHGDVERAMEQLRNLDRYLSRAEAEKFSEVAQGVVARHRENLGVQFKLAVNDKSWTEAVRIGETIIHEFPNSKMADEVRTMMNVLRNRASHDLSAGAAI